MGRKRRDMGCLRPFCFYCDKSFKNQIILHHHQKAKHFGCSSFRCSKKFSSIDSLISHAKTSHNEMIEKVPNATMGRDNVAMKIFGMQGVPRVQIESWISKSVNKYWGKRMDQKLRVERHKIKKLLEEKRQLQKIEEQARQQEIIQEEKDNQNLEIPEQFKMENL